MDADEVSVASTTEGEAAEDAVYEVEEILAEHWDIWDHDADQPAFRGVKYLTKWDGYPLHDLLGTWEPKEAFSLPDENGNDLPGTPPILKTWYERKKSMSETRFRSYCRKNIESFYAAIESAEKAKADRKAKRAKKRQKQARRVLSDSDDEDKSTATDELQRQTGLQHAASHETAANTGSSPSVNQSLIVRKPPLEQSDSSASDDEPLDPLQAKSARPSKKTGESLGGTKDSASGSQPRPIAKTIRYKTVPSKDLQAPSKPLKDTSSQKVKPAPSAPVIDRNKRLGKPAASSSGLIQHKATSSSGVSKAVSSGASSASTRKSAPLTGPASVKKASQNLAIKVVNQPKVQQRSDWTHGNKLFSTLHFRAVAQKRARAEGTPDQAALEIVNGVPGAVKPKSATAYDNPYGRREVGRDRAEQSPMSESLFNENVPLASWEVEKVPQVCASWRLSNNCPKTAQACPFMHRNKDPNGNDYPVGDTDGWIPPKYRKPPLTCLHWLNNKQGCYRPDDQCLFAHRNTGWAQNEKKHSGENIIQIDPGILPQHEKADSPLLQAPTAPKTPKIRSPRDLTCWYWANGQCRNTAETCSFRHYDTGVVARAPPSKEKDVSLDKAIRHDSITTVAAISKEPPPPISKETIDSEETNTVGPIPGPSPVLPPPLPAELPPAAATCEDVRKQISSVCKLDFGEMFASNDSKSTTGLMDRKAFLVYHSEEHAEELELITRWLLMHHVQIFGVHYAGAWEEFEGQIRSGGSGVIIVHPDFEYFTQLPGLGAILRHSVRVWSVGLQEGIEYDPASSEAPPVYRYDAIEIFPVGGFIYITDEVFDKEPQLALEIVESFFEKIAKLEQRTEDASLLWRLCVRPELMEYLFQECEQHEAALEAGDADIQSRAQLYALLAETKYIEQDITTEPLSVVFDKYPILSEQRIMAESEPMWYFSARARSVEAGDLTMVRYYAGLQVALRRDYRHFYVVHPQPQAGYVQQWQDEMQTIAGVLTPRQCVEELRKESEESMFDFCERFMRERKLS